MSSHVCCSVELRATLWPPHQQRSHRFPRDSSLPCCSPAISLSPYRAVSFHRPRRDFFSFFPRLSAAPAGRAKDPNTRSAVPGLTFADPSLTSPISRRQPASPPSRVAPELRGARADGGSNVLSNPDVRRLAGAVLAREAGTDGPFRFRSVKPSTSTNIRSPRQVSRF